MTNWLRKVFRRDRVRDKRVLNEDWQVGDLAECIGAHWVCPPGIAVPQRQRIYRVTAISEGLDFTRSQVIVGLVLEGMGPGSWQCTRFRKLRPRVAACDREFKAWLKDRLKANVDA